MSRLVAVDSNVFIYALNNDPVFGLVARQRFIDWETSQTPLVASVLVLTEVLRKHHVMAEHAILHTAYLDLLPVDKFIAKRAAQLLEQYSGKLKPLDALHLATAIEAGADEFVTNDRVLLSLNISELAITKL